MLEMPFIVVFTVSSSVQSIPNAVRATKPLIAFIAVPCNTTKPGLVIIFNRLSDEVLAWLCVWSEVRIRNGRDGIVPVRLLVHNSVRILILPYLRCLAWHSHRAESFAIVNECVQFQKNSQISNTVRFRWKIAPSRN